MIILAMPVLAQEGTPIMGNQAFVLTKHQISELEKLVLGGDDNAAIKLSNFYGFVTMDSQLEEKWLRIAANRGYTLAQSNLGKTLMARSQQMQMEAIRNLKNAAEAGDLAAISELARVYERGIGTSINLVKARELYELEAQAGDAHAMIKLGAYYLEGIGGTQDKPEGLAWLRKAMSQVPETSGTYKDAHVLIEKALSHMPKQEVLD